MNSPPFQTQGSNAPQTNKRGGPVSSGGVTPCPGGGAQAACPECAARGGAREGAIKRVRKRFAKSILFEQTMWTRLSKKICAGCFSQLFWENWQHSRDWPNKTFSIETPVLFPPSPRERRAHATGKQNLRSVSVVLANTPSNGNQKWPTSASAGAVACA